jgi:hypothetical protein
MCTWNHAALRYGEVAKAVPGYMGKYATTTEGRLLGPRGVIKGSPNNRGYPMATLTHPVSGRSETVYIHHVIARTFIGDMPEGHRCRLIDRDPSNLRPENLTYEPKRKPTEPSTSGHCRGEDHPKAKMSGMTEENVRSIRRMAKRGWHQTDLAELFGTSQPTISNIVHRITWGHVSDDDPSDNGPVILPFHTAGSTEPADTTSAAGT